MLRLESFAMVLLLLNSWVLVLYMFSTAGIPDATEAHESIEEAGEYMSCIQRIELLVLQHQLPSGSEEVSFYGCFKKPALGFNIHTCSHHIVCYLTWLTRFLQLTIWTCNNFLDRAKKMLVRKEVFICFLSLNQIRAAKKIKDAHHWFLTCCNNNSHTVRVLIQVVV